MSRSQKYSQFVHFLMKTLHKRQRVDGAGHF
jgi:hypothetical protein